MFINNLTSIPKILIIGLGNPNYDFTVHNMGSLMLKTHLQSINYNNTDKYFYQNNTLNQIYYFDASHKQNKYYMNEIGIPISQFVKYKKIQYLFVIFDDIRVNFGKWKIILDKNSRGHNGLKSILNENPSLKIIFISIGVGPKPPLMDLSDYVLSKIPETYIELNKKLVNDIFIYIYEEINNITKKN